MWRSTAALVLCLLAGCHPATAQGGACAAPAPWQQPGAKPGQPEAEFGACLQEKAYAARNVRVPVEAAANGIIAQCSVEVDRFEGALVSPGESGSDQQMQAAEQQDMQQATAAVVQFRRCVGQ